MAFDAGDYGGPATIEELEDMPDNGMRHELIGGEIVMTPPPGEWHQDVTYHLMARLGPACEGRGLAVRDNRGVYFAASEQEIIPDLVVYRAGSKPLRTVYLDPADVVLAVEVVSFSTRRRDRLDKPRLCAEHGIGLYLLVDPFPAPVTVGLFGLTGTSTTYDRLAEVTAGERLRLPEPFGFDLDTAGL